MEKTIKTKFLHVSIIFLFLVPVNIHIHCQDINGVQLSLKSYARWLERMNIPQSVLSVDTIETGADKAVLYLKSNCDKFAWNKLDSLCKTQTHMSLSNILIDRLSFDVDKPKSNDKIVIDGNGVVIIVTQAEDSVLTNISLKQGIHDSKTYIVEDIKFISPKTSLKFNNEKANIKILEERLMQRLQSYFIQSKPQYRNKNSFESHPDVTSLIINVKNTRGWIMPNHKYWEHIDVFFHFNQIEKLFIVDFYIDGEYASSGGDKEPDISEFHVIESKYLENIQKKIRDYLNEITNSK